MSRRRGSVQGMNDLPTWISQERQDSRRAAIAALVFALIAGPLVVIDGLESGTAVGLAPSVAVAVVWVVIAAQLLLHARLWAKVQETEDGLRSGLKARFSLDSRRVLLGLAAFFVVWMPWKLSVDRAMYAAEPWRAWVGIGGFFVFGGAVWWAEGRAQSNLSRRLAEVG